MPAAVEGGNARAYWRNVPAKVPRSRGPIRDRRFADEPLAPGRDLRGADAEHLRRCLVQGGSRRALVHLRPRQQVGVAKLAEGI